MAGAKLANGLRAAGGTLAEFPNRGRPTELDGIRELVVPGTPYLLAYRVKGQEVHILHIWHGAQDRS